MKMPEIIIRKRIIVNNTLKLLWTYLINPRSTLIFTAKDGYFKKIPVAAIIKVMTIIITTKKR